MQYLVYIMVNGVVHWSDLKPTLHDAHTLGDTTLRPYTIIMFDDDGKLADTAMAGPSVAPVDP